MAGNYSQQFLVKGVPKTPKNERKAKTTKANKQNKATAATKRKTEKKAQTIEKPKVSSQSTQKESSKRYIIVLFSSRDHKKTLPRGLLLTFILDTFS